MGSEMCIRDSDATVDWVRRLDDRLGKFVDRDDREQRIRELVESAEKKKLRG